MFDHETLHVQQLPWREPGLLAGFRLAELGRGRWGRGTQEDGGGQESI
jgi:hypothetical protein